MAKRRQPGEAVAFKCIALGFLYNQTVAMSEISEIFCDRRIVQISMRGGGSRRLNHIGGPGSYVRLTGDRPSAEVVKNEVDNDAARIRSSA
jgi:hypothetical protein